MRDQMFIDSKMKNIQKCNANRMMQLTNELSNQIQVRAESPLVVTLIYKQKTVISHQRHQPETTNDPSSQTFVPSYAVVTHF